MKIEAREYKLYDFIRIPFAVSPTAAALRVIDKIVYALIPALQILATARFIDAAADIFTGRAEKSAVVVPLACIFLLIAHQYITFALMGLVKARMTINLTRAFRVAVTEKRAALEYRHIEADEIWDLIARVGADPAGRVDGGFDILLRMVDMIFRVGSITLVLAVRVWWAALIILAFSVPLFWLAVKTGKTNYEASKEAAKHMRRAEYYQQVLTGRDDAEERALFANTDELNRRYAEKYAAAYEINYRAERGRFIKMKSASLITVLVSVMVAGVLIAPLGSGELSAGMFIGFVTASFGLAQMMSWELSHIASELAYDREYLRDLTAFAKLSETPGATDLPSRAAASPERIEFKDVSFAYPGTERMILKNLSLTLTARKHYAFVGVNGAGKTTITKLLTGLYDNYAGEISIDGRDLREFTQAELKSMFAIVYQDFARYQLPMIESVGVGDASAAREDVSAAVNGIGLGETVSKLPRGLDTPLGRIKETGVDLSGGEWQRVAIARALVSRAPVYILDEPTGALDPVAESDMYRLFSEISKDKSAVFITHRLGAARLADEIFVIDDGGVAERGTHAELIEKGGAYAAMFEAQRGWYA